MKKIIFLFLFLTANGVGYSQILRPVKWTFSSEQLKAGEATLIFKAKIDKGWHVYSQFTPDGGPMPMSFTFKTAPCFALNGKVTEPQAHEEFDSTFEVKVLIFSDEITLRQKIKLTGDACKISGEIVGQVCKEACILFDTSFVFKFGKTKEEEPILVATDTEVQAIEVPPDTQKIVVASGDDSHLEPGRRVDW